MLKQSLYSYKDALDREGVIFTFCGPISHDIVEGVGITLKSQMEESDVKRTTAMKVFSVFIEQVQNVETIHKQDLENGFGSVYMPYSLAKKYPRSKYETRWQFFFL